MQSTLQRLAFSFLSVMTLAGAAEPASCQDRLLVAEPTDPIVDVTVEWEIKLLYPCWETGSPQIITVLSQDATVDHRHHIFEVNHSSAPIYNAGGCQEQNWNGNTRTSYKAAVKPGVRLQRTGEVIEFWQSMALRDVSTDEAKTRYLYFGIRQLNSDTWGSSKEFTRTGSPTTLTTLSGFDIATCLRESGIAAGADRVEYMKIDNIDYTFASGKVVNDSTDYYVKSPSKTISTETDLTPIEVKSETAY